MKEISLSQGEFECQNLLQKLLAENPINTIHLVSMLYEELAFVMGVQPSKYTRIEITGTLERLAAGESIDEIVKDYQEKVSKDAITEAARLVTSQFIETLPELEPA